MEIGLYALGSFLYWAYFNINRRESILSLALLEFDEEWSDHENAIIIPSNS